MADKQLPTVAEVLDEKGPFVGPLEELANLSDGVEDYQTFAARWDWFWPLEIKDAKTGESLKWKPECHRWFLVYRDYLRRLWRLEPMPVGDAPLGVLLGTDHQTLTAVQTGEKSRKEKTYPELFEAWRAIRASRPDARSPEDNYALLYPAWGFGRFQYVTKNDFQNAVYKLFQENWRARICPTCSAYFIAQKPAHIYCKPGCAAEAKRKRDLDYWRSKGAERRAKRVKRIRIQARRKEKK